MITEPRLQRPRRQAEPRHVYRRHRQDHQGNPLTDNEYPRVAMLGWAIEFVRQPSVSSLPVVLTCPLTVPSLLPRLKRHDEFIDQASRLALLIPSPQCWRNRHQRLVHVRGCDILPPQEAFPSGELLCSSIFWNFSGDDVPDRDGAAYHCSRGRGLFEQVLSEKVRTSFR